MHKEVLNSRIFQELCLKIREERLCTCPGELESNRRSRRQGRAETPWVVVLKAWWQVRNILGKGNKQNMPNSGN